MSNTGPNPNRSPLAPVPKVVAAATSGAITLLVVVVAKQIGWDWVTEEVAAAAVLVAASVAGYFKRS